jgi:hypothetical protein
MSTTETPAHGVNTEDAKHRSLNVSNAEIAECLRDLCYAANMPGNEHRIMKVAGCVAGMERAIGRIENNVLMQPVTQRGRMAAALRRAAEQFAFYETQHRAKGTADGEAKAVVNRDMAAMCLAAAEGKPE